MLKNWLTILDISAIYCAIFQLISAKGWAFNTFSCDMCVETWRLSPPVSGPQNGQNKIKSGSITPLFLGNGSFRCVLPCHWPVVVYWFCKLQSDWMSFRGWDTELISVFSPSSS